MLHPRLDGGLPHDPRDDAHFADLWGRGVHGRAAENGGTRDGPRARGTLGLHGGGRAVVLTRGGRAGLVEWGRSVGRVGS